MKNRCLCCYQLLEDAMGDYHPACSKRFFGREEPPLLNYTLDQMKELAAQKIQERVAVTGAQAKISLTIEREKDDPKSARLTIVGLWGEFILKPPSDSFESLPENEDLTMHLAGLVQIKTAPHSLIRLKSGELAYITRRFDRVNKEKLAMEDLCQLSETLTIDKYKGSYEKAGKKIAEYSDIPAFDLLTYFEIILFSFITGNSDMHLKNFSLLTDPTKNLTSLSPAYDLLCTKIAMPEDKEEMALNLNGRKNNIQRSDFDKFAENLKLDRKAIENVYQNFASTAGQMNYFLEHGFLPVELKEQYQDIIIKNMNRLKLSIN